MTNKFGQAGRRGLRAEAAVAFLDAYTTREDEHCRLRVNGHVITPTQRRTIRRWRNGGGHINTAAFLRLIHEFALTLPWFHKWCKTNDVKVSD